VTAFFSGLTNVQPKLSRDSRRRGIARDSEKLPLRKISLSKITDRRATPPAALAGSGPEIGRPTAPRPLDFMRGSPLRERGIYHDLSHLAQVSSHCSLRARHVARIRRSNVYRLFHIDIPLRLN